MYKIFISTPMDGLSDQEITKSITSNIESILYLLHDTDEEIEFVVPFISNDSSINKELDENLKLIFQKTAKEINIRKSDANYFYEISDNPGLLWYLGRAIRLMDGCTHIYSCPGWINSRSCRAMYAVAKEYGIEPLTLT